MSHKSAFRELQDAVQAATDRATQDTIAAVLAWLSERRAQPEFATVLIAFKADFVGTMEAGE